MFLQRFRKRDCEPRKPPYPHLADMTDAYFHQDYDIFGETLEEVLAEYARTSHLHEVEGAIRELEDLLKTPMAGLLQRFESGVGGIDFIIAKDDVGARAWLDHTRDVLAKYVAQARGER